jgi:hypothetical protein
MIKLLKNFKNIFIGLADGIQLFKTYKQGKLK